MDGRLPNLAYVSYVKSERQADASVRGRTKVRTGSKMYKSMHRTASLCVNYLRCEVELYYPLMIVSKIEFD